MPSITGVAQAGTGFGHLLDVDQAHAAVGGDRQLVVVAEARDRDAGLVGGLDDHRALGDLHRDSPSISIRRDQVDGLTVFRRWRSCRLLPSFRSSTRNRLFRMAYSNSCQKWRRKPCTGHAAASPKAQMVWPSIWPAAALQHLQVFHAWPACSTMRVEHAVHPAGAFAARRALAAAFRVVETRDALAGAHHAGGFVHHDDRARTQAGAGFLDRVVVHGAGHHVVGRQHRHRRTAGDHRLELAAVAHAAGQLPADRRTACRGGPRSCPDWRHGRTPKRSSGRRCSACRGSGTTRRRCG